MQMHRQSLTAYGAPLCETVVDAPAPQGSEVLVRIARCGVCHSDLHMQDGYFLLGDGKQLDVRAGRTLPFTLGHEIAGVIESAGPDADVSAGRQGRGLSLDRLRPMRGLQGGRREHLRRAAPSRHHGRRRLRHACAGAASALSDRLRAAVAVLRRRADVLGAHRLCRAQAAGGPRRARAAAAGRPRRRRPDGAGAGARHVWHGALSSPTSTPKKREAALAAGAREAFDPADPDARKALLKASGGIYAAVDFVGSDKSLNFATGVLAKGGKVVVTGLIGGGYSTAVAMFPLKAMTIEGTQTGTLAEARELIDLVRAKNIAAAADRRAAAWRRRKRRSTTCARAKSSAAWC